MYPDDAEQSHDRKAYGTHAFGRQGAQQSAKGQEQSEGEQKRGEIEREGVREIPHSLARRIVDVHIRGGEEGEDREREQDHGKQKERRRCAQPCDARAHGRGVVGSLHTVTFLSSEFLFGGSPFLEAELGQENGQEDQRTADQLA